MIESAQYVKDDEGNILGITVVYNDEICTVPAVDGGGWLQVELQKWVAAGNAIAAAATVTS